MKKSAFASALLVLILLPMLLSACAKPMANKTLDNPNRDDTSAAMKKAGGADSD